MPTQPPIPTLLLSNGCRVCRHLTSGLMPLTGLEQSQEQIRDWPGIWLTCAGLVVVCLVVFALFFPGGDPEESAEDR